MQVWLFPPSHGILSGTSSTPSCDWNWWHLGYKGSHGNVSVSQTGAGSEKCLCYIKLFFLQHWIQPIIVFIYWVTGNKIKYFEKQAYEYYVILFWKNKYWEYRRVFLEWKITHIIQISSDHNTKEYGSKEELLILKYNLDGNVPKQ